MIGWREDAAVVCLVEEVNLVSRDMETAGCWLVEPCAAVVCRQPVYRAIARAMAARASALGACG